MSHPNVERPHRPEDAQRPDTVAISELARARAGAPLGITPVTRYRTEDGAVFETVGEAEAHIKKNAHKAWLKGLEHYLTRLCKTGTVISDGDLMRLASIFDQNSEELAEILLEKPK